MLGNVITGFNVTQASSPNLTVIVNPGVAIIREGDNPGQVGYHAVIDTTGGEAVTISTPNSSNPRIDYIVGYVDKSATPSGTNNTNVFKLVAVAGTPAATPAVPTATQIQSAIGSASNPYDIYAQVAVAKSATSITNSNITDIRSLAAASGGSIFFNTAVHTVTNWAASSTVTPITSNLTLPSNAVAVMIAYQWDNSSGAHTISFGPSQSEQIVAGATPQAGSNDGVAGRAIVRLNSSQTAYYTCTNTTGGVDVWVEGYVMGAN